MPKKTPIQRFIKHTKKVDSGCWLWTAFKLPAGYGMISINGKGIMAHRASWTFHKGEIPDGLQVCHTCDNPSCVNPEHLFLGTPKENTQDMMRKNRGTKSRRLSAESYAKIRQALAAGVPRRLIAVQFNISAIYVYKIGRNQRGPGCRR